MKNAEYDYILSPEVVDICSDNVRAYLTELGIPKRDIIRYTFSLEEILLKSLDGKSEVPIHLFCGKKMFRNSVILEIDGEANNIYMSESKNTGVLGESMLKSLGLSPEFLHTNGKNVYSFRLKKQGMNSLLKLLLVLLVSFAVGFAGLLLPGNIISGVNEFVLTPLHTTFLNVLGCIAGPMIFLSVAWGIYGIGDAATLRQIGKRLFFGFSGTVGAVALVLTFLCLPFFSLNFSDNVDAGGGFSDIFNLILGIVPKNIFSPFVDGNTLQIIFLAIVIGIAMVFLGKKTNAVALAVEQINYIVQFLIEFISKLVPYFVFIVVVKTVWSQSLDIFTKVAKLFVVYVIAEGIMIFALTSYTSLKNRVSPMLIIKKALPAFLIALTTASSAASFGTNMENCEKEFGIDKTITSFGVPFGVVMFKPATSVCHLTMALFFAEYYGIKTSVTWVAILIISILILSIATPPIPGGAMTAYTVLFTQLGIPAEGLAIALACDMIIDFLSTGGNQFMLPFALLNQAGKLGMVDRKILCKRSVRRKRI